MACLCKIKLGPVGRRIKQLTNDLKKSKKCIANYNCLLGAMANTVAISGFTTPDTIFVPFSDLFDTSVSPCTNLTITYDITFYKLDTLTSAVATFLDTTPLSSYNIGLVYGSGTFLAILTVHYNLAGTCGVTINSQLSTTFVVLPSGP